jgi:PKD repeat protein
VTDSIGNPRQGDRVLFTTTAGSLKSSGNFVLTDAQGHASDELTTDQTAEVTADAVDASVEPAKITIPVGATEVECSFTVSPQNPSVGTVVTFTDTSEIEPQRIFNSIWDFGDGTTMSGITVQHTYTTAGTFQVAHVIVDISGNSFSCPILRLTVS